ncbi:teichoic acid D-Ala incorporation-associated protein DltX [Enterococcus casseliflavus]
MKKFMNNIPESHVLTFVWKTILYFFVIVMIIYLYHYKNVQGGAFIYNEF